MHVPLYNVLYHVSYIYMQEELTSLGRTSARCSVWLVIVNVSCLAWSDQNKTDTDDYRDTFTTG